MTRYRLSAVLILIAIAQLALPFAVGSGTAGVVTDAVASAVVGLLLLFFFLRGSRVAYALLLVSAIGSVVWALAGVLSGNGSRSIGTVNALLDVAAALLIWTIWQETVATRGPFDRSASSRPTPAGR